MMIRTEFPIPDNIQAEEFPPDPIPLLESNRNLGYSFREAIADLIDNSITARASIVHVDIQWNDRVPRMILRDNGRGMGISTLVNSFKLGSKDPLEERAADDLGRFGFGMKTASLSQARCLTVISKAADESTVHARALDLSYIASVQKWFLRHVWLHDVAEFIPETQGTTIIWNSWDRAPKDFKQFLMLREQLENYLSVCFHRFIESGSLIIIVDGIEVAAVSPIPAESHRFSSVPLQGYNCVQTAYLLKHPHYWQEDYNNIRQFNSFRLFEGLERQQGIYVYRCNRLLTPHGGWLGLVRPENSAKLCRVVIDYPNNADHLWSLDITKTNAEIPFEFQTEIKEFLKKSRIQSLQKINRRAKFEEREIRSTVSNGLIWKQDLDTNFACWRYKLNNDHPIFIDMIERKFIKKEHLENIFKLIADNLPVAKIIQNHDEDPGRHDRIARQEKLSKVERELAMELLRTLMTRLSKADAIKEILRIEPWCYYNEELQDLFK